jgi:Zn-dependent peptidase ImmA (M78 family)
MDMTAVRQRAREIASRYNPEGLVPFPFREMARDLDNVRLVFLPLDISAGVSGSIFLQPQDQFVIIIDERKSEVRQYFTLAHEFAHYFIHEQWLRENQIQGVIDYSEFLDGQGMLLRPDSPQETTVDLQKEREANNFAAELIMPEDKVREFWEVTHDITKCAEAFQVSTSAMAIRLERLRLAS